MYIRFIFIVFFSFFFAETAEATGNERPELPSPKRYQLEPYPDKALYTGVEGCAYVSFMLTKKGYTKNVKVIEHTKWFDKPAKRLFRKMRFEKPSASFAKGLVGPFYGLLNYKIMLRLRKNGNTHLYQTDWECPFGDKPIDHEAAMYMSPLPEKLNPRKFDTRKFRPAD